MPPVSHTEPAPCDTEPNDEPVRLRYPARLLRKSRCSKGCGGNERPGSYGLCWALLFRPDFVARVDQSELGSMFFAERFRRFPTAKLRKTGDALSWSNISGAARHKSASATNRQGGSRNTAPFADTNPLSPLNGSFKRSPPSKHCCRPGRASLEFHVARRVTE